MKRDLELIREILLSIEALPPDGSFDPHVDGWKEDEVTYQIVILAEAGLIDAEITYEFGSDLPSCFVRRLTWEGHDFLDAAREKDRWEEGKKVATFLGGVAFDILKSILNEIAKGQVRSHFPGLFAGP